MAKGRERGKRLSSPSFPRRQTAEMKANGREIVKWQRNRQTAEMPDLARLGARGRQN
jgi:hypothetical protein